MRKIFMFLILAMSANFATAQMTSTEDNDPKAEKILDKLKKEFDSYSTMEVDFNLVMQFPGQPEEVQKGALIQSNDKFVLELKDRGIYTDGVSVWLHIKKNNEVQINDADFGEESDMMSPKDMLRLYENKKVIYALTDEKTVDGEKVNKIDFKPIDDESEFSKMTMYVTKKGNKMKEMWVFSKDGSRYILKIKDIRANKKYDDSVFVFDASKYPGIHVEDLRID